MAFNPANSFHPAHRPLAGNRQIPPYQVDPARGPFAMNYHPPDPTHPGFRPLAGHAQIPPYRTDPANRPYAFNYNPADFAYNPFRPLRINPYARLPPRPVFPRGNPPAPPIPPYLANQIRLSGPPTRPPLNELFDNIEGPFQHHRIRNLCVFYDNLIAALPFILAGPIIFPLYVLLTIPMRAEEVLYQSADTVDGEYLRRIGSDLWWIVNGVFTFFGDVVLRALEMLVLRPLADMRGFIRDRLLMREVWCFVVAVLIVLMFSGRKLEVEWSDDWREGLWYMLVPEMKRWAANTCHLRS